MCLVIYDKKNLETENLPIKVFLIFGWFTVSTFKKKLFWMPICFTMIKFDTLSTLITAMYRPIN